MPRTTDTRPAMLAALWEIQRRNGWTARQLADEIAVHESLISQFKRGARLPDVLTVRAMIRRFPELGRIFEGEPEAGTVSAARRA